VATKAMKLENGLPKQQKQYIVDCLRTLGCMESNTKPCGGLSSVDSIVLQLRRFPSNSEL
jgi:hypothetical protein